MTHILKNQEVSLSPGTSISGKWYQHRYQIVRKLGSGAIGTVYLAQSKQGFVALKIGPDPFAIASEANVLKRFSKVQGASLGPYFIEMDDWQKNRRHYTFYVMEYLQGQPFFSFLRKKGREWIGLLVLQLLSDLEKLHEAGWVFGDLKPDNLLITESPPRIRWIDVGGTTQIGRSIKEYTEFFDRGYWGLGSRKAEPSYDLFAVAMIFFNAAYPNRFKKTGEGLTLLEKKLKESDMLRGYERLLMKAIRGQYEKASHMRADLVHHLNGSRVGRTRTSKRSRKNVDRKQKTSGWTETGLVVSFLLFFYLLYLVGNLF